MEETDAKCRSRMMDDYIPIVYIQLRERRRRDDDLKTDEKRDKAD